MSDSSREDNDSCSDWLLKHFDGTLNDVIDFLHPCAIKDFKQQTVMAHFINGDGRVGNMNFNR